MKSQEYSKVPTTDSAELSSGESLSIECLESRRISFWTIICALLTTFNLLSLGLWLGERSVQCVRPQLIYCISDLFPLHWQTANIHSARKERHLLWEKTTYEGHWEQCLYRRATFWAWRSLGPTGWAFVSRTRMKAITDCTAITIKVPREALVSANETSIALKDGSGFIAELAVYHELHCIVCLFSRWRLILWPAL